MSVFSLNFYQALAHLAQQILHNLVPFALTMLSRIGPNRDATSPLRRFLRSRIPEIARKNQKGGAAAWIQLRSEVSVASSGKSSKVSSCDVW